MEINVTLGHDSDNGVCVTVADDQTYTPEVVADLLSRAGTGGATPSPADPPGRGRRFMNVTVLAAVDADPEQVRLEAIRSAAQQGANILGDPDVQTTGTIQANGETITLDGSGLALYTWPLIRSFVGLHNVSPALLPPHVT